MSPHGSGQAAVNVLLSQDETYAHLSPTRLSASSPSAFVSIQERLAGEKKNKQAYMNLDI